jgi:two-component system CheB/CheR fusion protein
VQQDVIELFHYGLNPDGTLLLGSAESVDASDLFRVEDKKLCFFRKRNVPPREPRLPVFPLTRTRFGDDSGVRHGHSIPPVVYGSLHQRLVEKYAPPSILVGGDNRILHLSEHAGRYLVPPGGEPTQSAVKMVREELRIELQAALHQARERKVTFDSKPVPVQFNGHPIPVVMRVRPSQERDEEGFVLVIFEEREPGVEEQHGTIDRQETESQRVQHLEAELLAERQRLQAIIEEYETSKEEMKASNEEMQSTNEELRSTMEELETSKEELQSINEELQTVNQQNRHKVEELGQLSSDLQNLLAATDIATLFLDRELRILRFTPKLGDLFNVRVTDRGRPISDLTHRLGYPDLIVDAQGVLSRLVPIERELQDDAGRWYLTRVHPYRSNDDRIEGVVVTFVDITDRKDAENVRLELQKREQMFASERAMKDKEVELARVSRTLMVGELATSIAHELNQPLAGVVTNAEAALRWLKGEEVHEAKNSLALIQRDANRASAVIRRVRDFVKNESNGSMPVDLREIIRETIALLQFDLEKSQIALSLTLPDYLSLIRGDNIQLEQVILNVIVNACEAMASIDDRRRELKISVSESADRMIVVAIRDTGVGIDPQQIDKVYDAFFTTKPTGIGMGLSISRSIVEAHGGQILVVPNSGPGVTVQVSLPVNHADPL